MILLLVLACATEPGPPVGSASSVDSGLGSAQETGEAQEAPDFRSATYCAECHPVHYEEWRQSMHAHAAQSPVFDAMNAKAFRDSGGGVGTFCTGCHSPFGTAAWEGGSTTAADRS